MSHQMKSITEIAKSQMGKMIGEAKSTPYMKHVAGVGAVGGLSKTINDDVDDGIVSTTSNMALGAIGAGGAYFGAKKLTENTDYIDRVKRLVGTGDRSQSNMVAANSEKKAIESRKESAMAMTEDQSKYVSNQSEKKQKLKVSDINDQEISVKAEKTLHDAKIQQKAKNTMSKLKLAGVIGAATLGFAEVLDIKSDIDHKRKEKQMVKKQEQAIVRNRNEERQSLKQMSYGNVDLGNIVSEMWNERIGHHKMGNSKFQ
ncbi:hypothetical protein KLEB273_gp006 [Bacillus phage vB_BauM_KLEB27-3]|nr:hypothetical protein KLEB273_gp006 [Bacillus phage vB_BauM_KLEB27-3]